MGVSLWLVPAAKEMDVVKSGLPRRPSCPAIVPHITLATVPTPQGPGITQTLLDAVPRNQQQIRANFRSLVVGDHYFRSVFIDIQPTQDLVGLQGQILSNLRRRGLGPSAPRFPHMSLYYIADEDSGDRDMTARLLRDTGVVRQIADAQSISLQCGDISLSGFDGVEVWVVNCNGPVETWEVDERMVKLTLKS